MLTTDFNELLKAFDHLSLSGAEQARLHDIWKMGAPTPDSIILDPKKYDERHVNTVRRIIPSVWLHPFIKEIAARRGIPLTQSELDTITNDYGGI